MLKVILEVSASTSVAMLSESLAIVITDYRG